MPAFAYVESKRDRKIARETAAIARAASNVKLPPFRRTPPAPLPVLEGLANTLRQQHIRALAERRAS